MSPTGQLYLVTELPRVGGRGEGGEVATHTPEAPPWDANGLEDKEHILDEENEEKNEEIE